MSQSSILWTAGEACAANLQKTESNPSHPAILSTPPHISKFSQSPSLNIPDNSSVNVPQESNSNHSQISVPPTPPPTQKSANNVPKFTVPSLHYKNPATTKTIDNNKQPPKNTENVPQLNNIPSLGSYDYHKSQQRSRSSSRDRKT